MPTITLNKTVFEKLVGKQLPIEKLKDKISMIGTDLEKIENDEIVVEVFPSRPDMLSEGGFARAFSAFIGVRPGMKKYKVQESDSVVKIEKSVNSVRPFTACALVSNLSFDDEKIREVIQIQEKLHVTFGRNRKKAAIGIYPLEHIKLPITYKALAPDKIKFHPLEARGEMTAEDIIKNHPTGKAYGHLLEGQKEYPIFIDANDEILSMPPIINSDKTGRITENTKDVFIECSGHDFETLSLCLNMIVTALSDMGGSIHSMKLQYPDKEIVTPNLSPREMKLELSYVNRMLGMEFTAEDIADYLEKMGYDVQLGKQLLVMVPGYRADILHPADLVEDIAIGYGYDKFKAEIPRIATTAWESREHKVKGKIAGVLVGLGLTEAMNYHLTNAIDQTQKMLAETETVALASAVNIEYNELRNWLLPGLLGVLNRNKHHEYPQNVFEMGTVFSHDKKTQTGVAETDNLAIVNAHKTADFTEAKQQLDALFRALDIKYKVESCDYPFYIPGRSGKVIVNGVEMGHIGELHPQVLQNYELDVPVAGFELNIEKIKN